MPAAPSAWRIDFDRAGPLAEGLRAVSDLFPGRFGGHGRRIHFSTSPLADGADFAIEPGPGHGAITVRASRPGDAFHALGRLMADTLGGQPAPALAATAPHRRVGVLLDVSRNGAYRPAVLRERITRLALMGVNTLYLYLEDTCAVPDQPFIGYFRGAYSSAELRALDDHAHSLGVEIVPCIQTLGHFEQILQWPAYADLADTPRILLADHPRTLPLLERILDAATSPFRSRRVHLGLDEAAGIGTGRHLLRHGHEPGAAILRRHLDRVLSLCRARGLEPMIWGDMFFRLGSPTRDYYECDADPVAIRDLPPELSVVYWDYYHTDPAHFRRMFARHRVLGRTPVFAGGVWTWNRFWANLPVTLACLAPGLSAAREAGVREVVGTLWGDDGAECDPASALAGMQAFATLVHRGSAEPDALARDFRATCDGDFAACAAASALDCPPAPEGGLAPRQGNLSKWLLWHDPVLGFLDAGLPAYLPEHYDRLAASLPPDPPLDFPRLLARVLALKARLHLRLRPAVLARDLPAVHELRHDCLPALREALAGLHALHHRRWHAHFRPQGWEVPDRRHGGLRARLDTLASLLDDFLAAPSADPEWLSCAPLPVFPGLEAWDCGLVWSRVATPSWIK